MIMKYDKAEVFVNGQSLGELTDCSFSFGEPEEDSREAQEEAAFLARAMFNAKLRDEAAKIAEHKADTYELPRRKDGDPYGFGRSADVVLDRMWERSLETTGHHVCPSCKHREPSEKPGGAHVSANGSLCEEQMQPEPRDFRLWHIRLGCDRDAAGLQRECARLTESGYPAEVEWWGDGDEEDEDDAPIDFKIVDDPLNPPLGGEQKDGAKEEWWQHVGFAGRPAPKGTIKLDGLQAEDKVPGVYLDIAFGKGPATAPREPVRVGVDPAAGPDRGAVLAVTPRGERTMLRTAQEAEEWFGAGSRMGVWASSILRNGGGPIEVSPTMVKETPKPSEVTPQTYAKALGDYLDSLAKQGLLDVASGPQLDAFAAQMGMTRRAPARPTADVHPYRGLPGDPPMTDEELREAIVRGLRSPLR